MLVKIENCMTFCKVQRATYLKEIQPPPPLDKILLLFWNKNVLTEIYRNIQTFAFKVLQECGSWASRYGTAPFLKMFFPTPNKNIFAGKFVK